MGSGLGSALHHVSHSMADAATGPDSTAASGVALGPALLPLIALVASLIAAVAVGSLVVSWLRKPELGGTGADTIYGGAGDDVFVANEGVITVVVRREGADGSGPRPKDVRLEFGGRPLALQRSPESLDSEREILGAVFDAGFTGGSTVVKPGSSVDVDRVVTRNGSLMSVTRRRFALTAEQYREPRPGGRFRAASIGGVLGVVLGFVSLALGDDVSASISWSAIIIGALALGLRVLLPRWIPLNAAGLLLRERSNELLILRRCHGQLCDTGDSNCAAPPNATEFLSRFSSRIPAGCGP